MIVRSIPYRDPLAAFSVFAADRYAVLLDSAVSTERYSAIAVDPFQILKASQAGVTIDADAVPGATFDVLQQEWGKYVATPVALPVPFAPGVYGFLGYELGGCLERLPRPKQDAFALPSMVMGFYAAVIVFDHLEKSAWIIGLTEPGVQTLERRLEQAPDDLAAVGWGRKSVWRADVSRAEMERNIRRVIEYIFAGDIFQANYTQRFIAQRPQDLSAFAIYRRLRQLSPAPFAAFLRCGEMSIASVSPERFLSLGTCGTVEAHPIKGTRPRASDTHKDAALAEELRSSIKDNAENLMIVDLTRSDLARVCRIGSVRVPKLCAVETFSSIHHLVSVVQGQMREDMGPFDLLRATFPGGSITGAPKIRAMEIIHELEPAPRGVYCGCIGWIGFNGALDMSIAIRTLTLTPQHVLAQAGGGIVADSDVASEYDECMIKVAPLLRAITGEHT
jgi:para-aminobenzoate synthetase component 1